MSEIDDSKLAERITEIIEQRDNLLALAGEMIATLILPRNVKTVHPELKLLAEGVWEPAFKRYVECPQLTDDQIDYVIAANGIDVKPACERLRKLVEKKKNPSLDSQLMEFLKRVVCVSLVDVEGLRRDYYPAREPVANILNNSVVLTFDERPKTKCSKCEMIGVTALIDGREQYWYCPHCDKTPPQV